jgi:hypothetical protein
MIPRTNQDPAILVEFKKADGKKLEAMAEQALIQIKEQKYTQSLIDAGYKGKVLLYGTSASQKKLIVKMETETLV